MCQVGSCLDFLGRGLDFSTNFCNTRDLYCCDEGSHVLHVETSPQAHTGRPQTPLKCMEIQL